MPPHVLSSSSATYWIFDHLSTMTSVMHLGNKTKKSFRLKSLWNSHIIPLAFNFFSDFNDVNIWNKERKDYGYPRNETGCHDFNLYKTPKVCITDKHNPFVSCNINNTKEINDIVKASCVKIMPLTRSVECEWLNKSPLPTNVSDTVNAPLSYTLDIDDCGGNNSCSLSDVAECSIILDKKYTPLGIFTWLQYRLYVSRH